MKKLKKFKDEFTKQETKRLDSQKPRKKKKTLNPNQSKRPKYRNNYLSEEE